MPISRTRKDYIISGLVLVLITAVSFLGVYFTHPKKERSNATTTILGIDFPNFQGIIMRQPRMTIILFAAFAMLVTGFIFISRSALPFFSRPIAWSAVAISGVALAALGFFTKAGTEGGWFRFALLCFVFLLGATVLTEAMIFYRRLIHDKPFRTSWWHRIIFAIACAVITGAMFASYYHYAVDNGIFLNYGVKNPSTNTQIPDVPSNLLPTDGVTTPSSTP